MSHSSKKTPWHLRFTPGAILRQIGLAVLTLTMLVGVQMAQMMASGPTIDWCPKYESKTEFSMSMLMGHQMRGGPYVKETEFSSEYFEPGHRRLKATAVEEKHNRARNRSWLRKTTLLSKNEHRVTIHEFKISTRRFRRVSGSGHLDLVNHKKVGEVETINTVEEGWKRTPRGRNYWVSKKERITEKWENKVFFNTTQSMDEGPFEFSVHFGARNDFIPSDDLNCSGYCEASRISAYPGPATSVSPCVPSNMSMPRNSYLEFHHWTQYVPDPDDDDE